MTSGRRYTMTPAPITAVAFRYDERGVMPAGLAEAAPGRVKIIDRKGDGWGGYTDIPIKQPYLLVETDADRENGWTAPNLREWIIVHGPDSLSVWSARDFRHHWKPTEDDDGS